MSAYVVERELKGVSVDQLGVTQKAASAGSQWQTRAESKWERRPYGFTAMADSRSFSRVASNSQ
jgi:hypothetical protein